MSGVPLGGEDGTGTPAASPIVYIYTLGVWVSRHRELKTKKLFLLFFGGSGILTLGSFFILIFCFMGGWAKKRVKSGEEARIFLFLG